MTDSLARLSSMIESAKDLTIEAAVSASARLTESTTALAPKEITKQLNSRVERDVLNGMKCVISVISRGEDGLPYFADVVKNITTSNQKIRDLVLVYLTRYAEVEPDIALLSINSIQRSLNDKNPKNRSISIRSLAGIRISSIIPILILSFKRTSADPSYQVRCATSIAIGKVYEKEDSSRSQLFEMLSKLISDSDVRVVASAVKSYYKISPDLQNYSKRWTPIHGNFRRLCSLVDQFDEWSQTFLIEILTEYCRRFLPKPSLILVNGSSQIIDIPADYETTDDFEVSFDEDMELFLNALRPLVYSHSESVILSVSKALLALAPPKTFIDFRLNEALLRIATLSKDLQTSYCALQFISNISSRNSHIFEPYFKKFYLYPSDSVSVSCCKLRILSLLSTEGNIKYILEELKYYATNSTNSLVAAVAIKSIGRCSQIAPEWNKIILGWCLRQIRNTNSILLTEILTVIRFLLQKKAMDNLSMERNEIIQTIFKLSLLLSDDEICLQSEVKSCAIWIIGEMTVATENSIGPDVLRQLIPKFSTELESVRYQILILAAKVFSYELDRIYLQYDSDEQKILELLPDNRINKMFQFVLQLAKYDSSYDTRDKARMLNVLLGNSQRQLASLFLQVPKAVPIVSVIESSTKSQKLDQLLENYLVVNDWSDVSELPDSSIREPVPILENNLTSRMAFNGVSSPKASEHAISSESYHRANKVPEPSKPPQTYQLQSLDEFFGKEDEVSESESSEDSSEEDYSEDSSEEDSDAEESSEEESSEEELHRGTYVEEHPSNDGDDIEDSSEDA